MSITMPSNKIISSYVDMSDYNILYALSFSRYEELSDYFKPNMLITS